MPEASDIPEVAQPSSLPDSPPPTAPVQIPTRGGRRQSTDPTVPGVHPSSTIGWLREMMARAPTVQPSPQPPSRVQPSTSDLSAASPSMFINATSRRESGQLRPLSVDPRSETSLINPTSDIVRSGSVNRSLSGEPSGEFPFPSTNTGISVPTTAIPSLPSGVSMATSSGVSTFHQDSDENQDPDETVSLTYFGRQPRRYRSDADVVHNAPSDEDSEDVSYDDVGDRLDVEDSPERPDPAAQQYDIYEDNLFRDSLSILALDIERSRATRREEARREETEQGAARARQATLAQSQRPQREDARSESASNSPGPSIVYGTRRLHFQEPLLPVADVTAPIPPEPAKWTNGLKRLSRFFGREPRATPDLELGDERIPYAQKGKGKVVPPPPKAEKPKPAKPARDSPGPSLLQRLKGKQVTRENFLDMSSDHGSPLQLPAMASISGVTRKLSFRRQQPQSPKSWLDMGPDPFAKDPIRRVAESAPPIVPLPSRLSTVYERLGAATRAMTIKKRTPFVPHPYDRTKSKAELVLGVDLSSYKPTQSYPDLLQPTPLRSRVQFSNPNLRPTRPATSSGLRPSDFRPTSFTPDLRASSNPRPTSFMGNHPFYTAGISPRQPLTNANLPPREPLLRTAEEVAKDFGKWFKGMSRPGTADGTRRPSWAPVDPRTGRPNWYRNNSDRRASVGSRAESMAQRLERMVSNSSSQLEPVQPQPAQAVRLYPGGIDPVADPELYEVVARFEMHRRAEDERREAERRVSESSELHISATSFPMPPTPRQVPVRRSSLPRQPVPVSPRLLSPTATSRPWRTPSPAISLQVVLEDAPAPVRSPPLVLGPPLSTLALAPSPRAGSASVPAPSPALADSSPGVLAGYDSLSPVHPPPISSQPTPNVLGLSTAPSTATMGSRVSFAPSPPRHSHIDLREFLMTSPSQIIRTTSAAEFRRPDDTGPAIPAFPASHRELVPYILCESDVWKRQDQEYSSSDDIDGLWHSSGPRYTWKPYRLVLTSSCRVLEQDHRSEAIPPDLESQVCIHLFKILPRARPSTAPASKSPAPPAKYDPEVTRRVLSTYTAISTFQPYTVDTRSYHRDHMWKDEDDEKDVTQICEVVHGREERVWYLTLPSLDAYVSWADVINTERDCLVANALGCGLAFRDRLSRPHPKSTRSRILDEEIAAAFARWSTRRLALENDTPPPSPIRPAPRIMPGEPSKGILKKRASTGDIKDMPIVGAYSDMQRYIDGLTAFERAYDMERSLREERYRDEGLYDDVPRIRTETDRTIRPGDGVGAGEVNQPGYATELENLDRPRVRLNSIRRASARAHASTSLLDTRPARSTHPPSQARSHPLLEPTPALSDISLPPTETVQSPDDFITILPRPRPRRPRPKVEDERGPAPPPDSPSTTRSRVPDAPDSPEIGRSNAPDSSNSPEIGRYRVPDTSDTSDTSDDTGSSVFDWLASTSPLEPDLSGYASPHEPDSPGPNRYREPDSPGFLPVRPHGPDSPNTAHPYGPDLSDAARSESGDSRDEDLSNFVDRYLDSIETHGDANVEVEPSNPLSPPSSAFDVPFAHHAEPYNVSTAPLPSDLDHLRTSQDHEPSRYGPDWPGAPRNMVAIRRTLAEQAIKWIVARGYNEAAREMDRILLVNAAYMASGSSGPPPFLGTSAPTSELLPPRGRIHEDEPVFSESEDEDSSEDEAEIPEVPEAPRLQEMEPEQRRVDKGKGKEVDSRPKTKKVVKKSRKIMIKINKENIGIEDKGKEADDAGLKMKEVSDGMKGKKVTVRPSKENIDVKGKGKEVEDTVEIKREGLRNSRNGQDPAAQNTEEAKGKKQEIQGVKGISDDTLRPTVAQTKPVNPPKRDQAPGPSSIRSTRSTRSAVQALQSQATQSTIANNDTPAITVPAARALTFDTPDQTIYTPFPNPSLIERGEQGTPTHRATRHTLRPKRPSEEELQKEKKRVKEALETEAELMKESSGLLGKSVDLASIRKGLGKENEAVQGVDVFGSEGKKE